MVSIEIHTFPFRTMLLKMLSAKWCLKHLQNIINKTPGIFSALCHDRLRCPIYSALNTRLTYVLNFRNLLNRTPDVAFKIDSQNFKNNALILKVMQLNCNQQWKYNNIYNLQLQFPSLGILLEYWFERVTFGLLNVMLIFLTRICYWGDQSSRLCNWLPMWRLVPWINHLPPECRSIFWKFSLKW